MRACMSRMLARIWVLAWGLHRAIMHLWFQICVSWALGVSLIAATFIACCLITGSFTFLSFLEHILNKPCEIPDFLLYPRHIGRWKPCSNGEKSGRAVWSEALLSGPVGGFQQKVGLVFPLISSIRKNKDRVRDCVGHGLGALSATKDLKAQLLSHGSLWKKGLIKRGAVVSFVSLKWSMLVKRVRKLLNL